MLRYLFLCLIYPAHACVVVCIIVCLSDLMQSLCYWLLYRCAIHGLWMHFIVVKHANADANVYAHMHTYMHWVWHSSYYHWLRCECMMCIMHACAAQVDVVYCVLLYRFRMFQLGCMFRSTWFTILYANSFKLNTVATYPYYNTQWVSIAFYVCG